MERTGITPRIALQAALVAFGLSLLAVEAHAISRYTSTAMSCSSVRATVKSEGAVILRWRSAQGNARHGRFVATSRYCAPGETAVVAHVPSSDRKSCAVRECKRCSFDDDDDDFFFLLDRC